MESVALALTNPVEYDDNEDAERQPNPPGATCLQLAGRTMIKMVSHPATTFCASFVLVNSLCSHRPVQWAVCSGAIDVLSTSAAFLDVNSEIAMVSRFAGNALAGACGATLGFLVYWIGSDKLMDPINGVWAVQ